MKKLSHIIFAVFFALLFSFGSVYAQGEKCGKNDPQPQCKKTVPVQVKPPGECW